MLNLIYKASSNNNNNEYVIFPKWYVGLDGYTSNRSNEETLELRQLKLVSTGFNKPLNLNDEFSFDGVVKIILERFRTNLIIVDKVIENKNLYYYNDIKKLALKFDYKVFFSKCTNELKKKLLKVRKRRFEIFIANRTKTNDILITLLKFFYNRLFEILNIELNLSLYFNGFSLNSFDSILINSSLYAVQVYEKMIKLITKTVLLNSKFFFLNNIKYNYTLLKFCDKSMKLVNSILLFCLLCDINIPYYCFHSDLSIAGNCRMCLVQLDTSLKPIASCAVSISINSTIYTNTKIIQKAREGVLEFLLINHPLDCPICDQGGECDLQEQFITYGNDRGRFLKKMI